ncbi:MAG: F0F1 ATP synthase subunit epsilon [Granulosicoccus sp.]
MANSLHVEIVSAEEQIWSGDALLVSASAQMGEVGIAPGHTPFISRIRPGEVRVKPADDSDEVDIYVSGGIMEVQPHVVTILADTALRLDEIDEAAAQKAKEEAEAALAGAKPGEIDYAAVQAQLAEASAQLQLIKKLRSR